jgi:hypothetical protein
MITVSMCNVSDYHLLSIMAFTTKYVCIYHVVKIDHNPKQGA